MLGKQVWVTISFVSRAKYVGSDVKNYSGKFGDEFTNIIIIVTITIIIIRIMMMMIVMTMMMMSIMLNTSSEDWQLCNLWRPVNCLWSATSKRL